MLEQLIIQKNNVDLSKMPERYPLYLGLDNLKKKILKRKEDAIKYSSMIDLIDSALEKIKLGENKEIVEKIEELLDNIMQSENFFGKFSKNFEEIGVAFKKIETIW